MNEADVSAGHCVLMKIVPHIDQELQLKREHLFLKQKQRPL